MSNQFTHKPPTWFWVVSALALLWNLLGVMMYLGQAFMTPEMIAELSAAQQADMAGQPAWYTAAFAIAVFGGALASVFLLIRRKWAIALFAISLLGILVQQSYHFVLSNMSAHFGPADTGVVVAVTFVGFVLLWFANHAAKQGWLR